MAKVNVEHVKDESNYLRGDLPAELTNEQQGFSDAGQTLIKFHGMYEQEDRDSRKERKKQNLEPLVFFMVRSRLPGGKMSAAQYLTHDELADRYANGSIRLTSRQGIQFHGIFKRDLKGHMQGLNDALVTTLAACGDVNRNVMCCPAPIRNNSVRDDMQRMADLLSDHFLPRTAAYHEIWLNGEKAPTPPVETIEPIYGKHYLPRKFKTAVALPEDNCVDVLTNDLGLVVSHQGGSVRGYNIYAGGGLGATHGMAKTYPRLASPICFADPDEALAVCEAIVKVQRDFGNREDRKQARLKYTIDRMGLDAFIAKVQEYYGRPLAPPNGERITAVDDHLGWHEQGDGNLWVGIHILAGRIADNQVGNLKSTLRSIVSQFKPTVRISATQNLLLCDVDPKDRSAIEKLLTAAGFKKPEELPKLVRHAMACVATPTCGLALAESERVIGELLADVQTEIASLGLSDENIVLHMTGCPNACARPFNADIGVVGRSPGKYVVYVGGNWNGDALNYLLADLVPFEQIGAKLRGPLTLYKAERQPGEGFGDFCRRAGKERVVASTTT